MVGQQAEQSGHQLPKDAILCGRWSMVGGGGWEGWAGDDDDDDAVIFNFRRQEEEEEDEMGDGTERRS